ncbi:uncharacterized protein LACBIDRAFT_332761 [Laccaria bicolor S238N-H82]|uniref:Predicted protein n=1 Tax=Laccaria bicolor (strain S238N-H82 / ATCC MYA-4686) TaxID=486041 RepID=B0DU01_LACBS|nr:uncharacterized protein LACBIDRAFT_332761 [Laccaria bicolor S238N-H82]EDR02001.1 predicted protein [Laccaria bicolor S238N-H82]|eukprot:XP_001887392.1 predicted protein [Laccaria bicolor S238N-H82]
MAHPPQRNKDADGARQHTTSSRNNYNHPGTTRTTRQRHVTNPQQTHDIEGDRWQARTTVTRLCRTQPAFSLLTPMRCHVASCDVATGQRTTTSVVVRRLCFAWRTTTTALKMKTTMDEGVGGGPRTKMNAHGRPPTTASAHQQPRAPTNVHDHPRERPRAPTNETRATRPRTFTTAHKRRRPPANENDHLNGHKQ